MLPMPSYYDNSEWYDKKTGSLKEGAPEEIQDEYRFYHAIGYYIKKPWGNMVAEYLDDTGNYYILNDKGKIIKKGRVDKTHYEHYDI